MNKIKYIFRKIRGNYQDKYWWKNQITVRVLQNIHKMGIAPAESGIKVMEQDWDNLIVLDACRADLFEEVVDVSSFDEYRTVVSQGSMTAEWTKANFASGDFGDTVYLTSNPWVSRITDDVFHEVVNVWQEGFDESSGTVPPDRVLKAADSVVEKYPNKRLIIHFMQPHHPFTSSEKMKNFSEWNVQDVNSDMGEASRPRGPFEALEMGLVDYREVWNAYGSNLELVYSEIVKFTNDLNGRTVITSDHGNLMGERGWPLPIKLYGHPRGLRLPPLVNVPWAVMKGERRQYTDEGTHSEDEDEETARERLRQLGYV